LRVALERGGIDRAAVQTEQQAPVDEHRGEHGEQVSYQLESAEESE
jgi:hypothetical protein